MWRSVDVDRKTHFIKYERDQESHKISFSNVVNLWIEKLSSSDLSKRCKEMNSLVEADPEDLAKHVCTLIIDSEEDVRITSKEEGEMRMLHFESKLAGIPFYFMFKMEKMNSDVFCKELTIPMMLLAEQQQSHLAQLRALLIAKDSEIDQYKLEGAILKKRKVETEPYLQSELAQTEIGIFPFVKTPDSVDLFKKLCHHLPPTSSLNETPLKRKSLKQLRTTDIAETESEEKSEAEPLSSTIQDRSIKEENLPTEAPDVVQRCLVKSKKPKLRI